MRLPVGRITIAFVIAFCLAAGVPAQTKWYKFDKVFVDKNYSPDSAFGELHATKSFPAKNVHSVGCGGDDGELHVGVPGDAVKRKNNAGLPVSSLASATDSGFGVVVEPPNVKASLQNLITSVKGKEIEFTGYYRVWNEGHDTGPVFPSNPHHVLELHPAWSFRSGTKQGGSVALVFPMAKYRGYGATKFKPLLKSLSADQWLKVAEDNEFVYVQLKKAENFYQLPVRVKQVNAVGNGAEVKVDVFSNAKHTKLVYSDLTVIVAAGTGIATQLAPNQKTFLLGFFSVNLRKAMVAAGGHSGIGSAVFAPATLEFFAFGFPQQKAVSSSGCSN